jgi:hypothetical protein
MAETVEPAAILAELADYLGKVVESPAAIAQLLRDREKTELVKALQALAFPEPGILSVLKKVGKGEELSTDEVKRSTAAFRKGDDAYDAAVATLAPERTLRKLNLSAELLARMGAVGQTGLEMRRLIGRLIAETDSPLSIDDKKRLGILVSRIERLNRITRQLETLVNPYSKAS